MMSGLRGRCLRAARRRSSWVAGFSAFGLGALLSVSLAPLHILLSLPLALGGLGVLALWARSPLQASAIGWLAGAGYFGFGLSWIVEPFQVDAARYAWMAPFALVFLAAGLALFWAVGFGLAVRWSPMGGERHTQEGRRLVLLLALWSLMEIGRAYLFTGFPWAGFGQFWIDTPAAQLLPWIGGQGLAVLTLAVTLPLALLRRRPLLAVSPLLGVALAGYALPQPPEPEMTSHLVRLVQPNAPQAEKWLPGRRWDFVRRAIEMSAAGLGQDQASLDGASLDRASLDRASLDQIRPDPVRPDLIVWPETSVPQLLNNADDTLSAISERVAGVPVLLGIQRRAEGRYYNSAVRVSSEGRADQIYDKAHLVPFGEYVPFGDLMARFGIHGFAAQNGSGYSAGPGPTLMDLGIGQALPLICYEAVFARDVNATPARPDMLIQITNDAWFGTRSGPYQHLVQARMRAAEQGLPMLRAANTGITAMIDPFGRLRETIALGKTGVVDAVLPQPLAATVYSRTGDLPVVFLCIAMGLAAVKKRRRSAKLS
ncbi:apolipoprotein N-acyltransferase [Pseudophaeobacter arcticus]|uniref:apolipoprotein N-acyltransferase n=1 Tax=Pseudophaeobacter arcticus TaxID=385492 RepID=UPI0024906054|nr:apolipoprotein N-acyltransferase [Pseudophaeobacter arcticus]